MKIKSVAMVLFGSVFAVASHASNLCSVGDQAQVLWKGTWYPAVVTRVNEDQSRCFIHYSGYESSWDEWVGSDRYRSLSAKKALYGVGDAVEVRWKGKWYPASILKIGDHRYRIHYEGYDNSWDEWVGPDRIRGR